MTKAQLKSSLDEFTRAYIECALWSSTAYGSPEEQADDPGHEGHFDKSFETCGYDDLTIAALKTVIADCKDFQEANADLLAKWYAECGETEERAGHDFWLNRNGHGAGFWDRWSGLNEEYAEIGDKLADAARVYGSQDWYYSRGKVEIS